MFMSMRPPGAHVADGAAVHLAAVRLELVDDLHRAALGRAGDRAAGEARLERVERVAALGEASGDRAHQVVDGGEALQLAQAAHLHAAGLAHLAEVVAQQVHDHHVLGAVLLARATLRRPPRPRRDRRARRACP
jgi:hypothetical protein